MDAYLHNLRMKDKYARNLTTLEIAQAFPECRDIARQIMDELIEKTKHWSDIIKQEPLAVHFMSVDLDVIQINNLQKYLRLTSPISNNRIDTAKAKLFPIQDLYDFKKVKKTSTRIHCSCAFHEDKNPSAIIYLKDNVYHCFSCGSHMDSIAFKMAISNLNFINAVKSLQ